MYVGNEYFYRPGPIYEDENGRRRRKRPVCGKDIYMWWAFTKYICKDGTIHHYKSFNFSVGSQREQYYCKPGEHYPDKFIKLHRDDFCDKYFSLIGSLPAYWDIGYKPKKKKINHKRGRPRAFDSEVYDLLEPAGFGTNGSEIVVKYKNYLTTEAAIFRFSLLSDDDKAVIGDAANLLALCRQAYSLLKSRNRQSINTSYEQCFRDNVIEKIGRIEMPTAEQLRTALVAA